MKVSSTDGLRFYDVTSSSCTCPDYSHRQAKIGGKCKHMKKHYFPWMLSGQPQPTLITEGALTLSDKDFLKDGVMESNAYDRFGDKLDKLIQDLEVCRLFKNGRWHIFML